MPYEITIAETTTGKKLCDMSMDRVPLPAEANYLAVCVSKARQKVGPERKALEEAVKAFNDRYPLNAKLI